MHGSTALTKISSLSLAAIVVVAAVVGSSAYVFWSGKSRFTEAIKIGICADLDNSIGKGVWRAAVLAAEQVNAQGGVLGRNFTVVAEDDDSESSNDIAVGTHALTKLITVDKADYVVTPKFTVLPYQDIAAEQKKILISVWSLQDEVTQRVLDNYDRYKYFFRVALPNNTASNEYNINNHFVNLGNYTGFTKVATLFVDATSQKQSAAFLNSTLPKYGFKVVYQGLFMPTTTDFSSYFAAIEASGAEILVPFIPSQAAVSFVKEWYDRQSPFVIWGTLTIAQESDFWRLTDGKCDGVSFVGMPVLSGYPLTSETVPTREAYLKRWGTNIPSTGAAAAYDTIRFILPDAIKRAGTSETEAVIKALEGTSVETSLARRFAFTSSHDVMMASTKIDKPGEEHFMNFFFQWQDEKQVPVSPKSIMEESGSTYKFPSWQGPWDNITTP